MVRKVARPARSSVADARAGRGEAEKPVERDPLPPMRRAPASSLRAAAGLPSVSRLPSLFRLPLARRRDYGMLTRSWQWEAAALSTSVGRFEVHAPMTPSRLLLIVLTLWGLLMIVPDLLRVTQSLGSLGFFANNDGLIFDANGPFPDRRLVACLARRDQGRRPARPRKNALQARRDRRLRQHARRAWRRRFRAARTGGHRSSSCRTRGGRPGK